VRSTGSSRPRGDVDDAEPRESTINKALTDIRPAAKTLTDNTDDLVALLKQADKLGHTAKRIVDANRDDVALIVKELGPVLAEVNTNSNAVLLRPATPLGRAVRQRGRPNNYANLYATVHLGAGAPRRRWPADRRRNDRWHRWHRSRVACRSSPGCSAAVHRFDYGGLCGLYGRTL
jgi:hypothetical protein